MSEAESLREKLVVAVEALQGLGDFNAFYSKYDSAEQFASHIQNFVEKMKNAPLSQKELMDLFVIFGPTGEFDEYFRDANFSNEVCRLIEKLQK